MGFLEAGAPLSWEASARYREVVKRRGVREFLQLYKQFRADVFPKSTLSWGDEVEYCLLNLDVQNKVARLYLGAEGVLGELKTRENLVASEQLCHQSSDTCANALLKTGHDPLLAATTLQATAASTAQAPASAAPTGASSLLGSGNAAAVHPEAASTATGDSKDAAAPADTATAAPRWPWQMSNWHPEYGAHMIEAIPGRVYPLQVDSILDLLPSMQVRRKKVQAVLPPGCYVASMGSFPTMGAPESRVRPRCCHVRFSPTCCCPQAAARTDTCGNGGTIGDRAAGESAAREKDRSTQTHGAAAPEHPATAHLRPAVDVTAASTVSAATDTAAGAGSLGTASLAGEELARGGVAAEPSVSAAILGAEGPRPSTAASSTAAAYPLSPTKADEERGKADTSVFRVTSKLQSHILSGREFFHAVENFVPSKQVNSQRGVVAEAEEEIAMLTTQREEESLMAEKAAVEGEEETVEQDERTTEDCGAAADGGQGVNDGHFTQPATTRPSGVTKRRTPPAVAEEVCSSPCLALVGVAAHTGDFASPSAVPDPIKSRSRSLFVGDALINPHPRFGTLTANIRERRGKKVQILIPLFVDENTAFTSRLKSLAMNVESHIPPAAPPAGGCAFSSHIGADEIAAVIQGATGGRGGAGSVCAAGAAGGKAGAAGTRAAAAVPGQGGAAEAGANRPATADCAGKASRVAGGSNVENIPCVEEACSEEEYYRRLMLEGKILHDGKFIYMDAMGFGMGMHCVQATFGCPSMRDARYLYDQLAVLAPLWLSLSAATPFMRGLLAAVDSRWDVISACVDCRTDAEKSRLPKSRYGTVSLYISDEAPLTDHLSFYNDVPAPVNERAFAALVENGVDEILARHMAFLFVRDPLVIFKDKLLAHKPTRLKTTAPVCGIPRLATDTVSGSAASAAPTSSAMATTSSGPTTTSVASTAVVAGTATPTDTVAADTMLCILSHPSSLPTTSALKTACSGYRSTSSVRLPLQQQRERGEQQEQPARTHHKGEDAGEDDTAVVAEAAAAWGIDDGTVYTETQDFENIQSTNWNSVRFKPPAAFKPWSVSGTPHGPSGAYESGHSSLSKRNSESNRVRDGQRSNSRRWSCGSGSRRTRTNQHTDVYSPSSAGGSGKVREEIGGGLDRFENAGIRKRNRGNSVSTIVPAPFLGIADCTAGLPGGNGGLPAAPTVRSRSDAGAAAAGEGEPRRNRSCVQKVTAHAKKEKEATAASSQRKLPFIPGEHASSSLSSLFRPSHTSVPPSSTSSSAAAATGECCTVPWRVEFRTPDVQLTDFENVACLSLVSVLVQVILEERLDLYLPMSLNDENTRRAVECNSILRQKFWFRNDVRRGTADRSFGEYSLHQILFGGSASRNNDASPLQILRDPSSSTPLPFACRSPFSPAAIGSTLRSSFCRSPFVPPASSFTSSGAIHLQTPQFSPCSPVSSWCTPTVAIPSAKPCSAIPSPFSASAAHLPPLRSPEASPGVLPGGSPPLLHFQNVESGDEYSPSAPARRAAVPGRLDCSPATTLVSPCGQSPRTAATASAAFRLCSCVAVDEVSGGAHTTATETSLSMASSVPRAFSPTSVSSPVSPFVGLVPLCLRYIEKEVVAGHCSREAAAQYLEYFDFLRHRTEGLVPTDASFLRACLAVHPAYNQDSVVPTQACFDLCQLAVKVGHGEFQVPELFGPFAGRAGMRVSADCCDFDNGVPVVTSSFLSQFVSDALKAMLRGYVSEAPNGCWQEEKQHLFACTRWGATDVKDRAGVGSQRSYAWQDTRTAAAVATTELQRVAQRADTVTYSGGQGVDQELDSTRASASATEREILKEQDATGETACRVILRDKGAATEDGARLRSDIATIRRGKGGTPVPLQNFSRNGPASDFVLPLRAAATRSKATTTTVEFIVNGDSCGEIAEAGQTLQNETEICREPSTTVACTSFSSTNFQGGKNPQDNGSDNSNTLIDKRGNSTSEAENRPKEIFEGEEELRKDLDHRKAKQGSEPIFRDATASRASRGGSVTTEKKVHYPVRLDIGSYSVLQEHNTIRSTPSLTTAAPAGTSGLAGDDDVSWNGSGSATAPRGTYTAAQLQEGIKGPPSCKVAAPIQRRAPPPFVALVSSSFAGEAGGSGPRMLFREEMADRRISFALSGKTAASLCNADTVSMLRSYMSDPLCRSTAEAGSCAPAVPAAAGAGRERSCKMYSGWPDCASVGVTNEEATGLWLFLTSGLHYSWRCDDSGSTSCSSTDDDRESADEACNIPRLLFSSGEVMAYSKAVLDASA